MNITHALHTPKSLLLTRLTLAAVLLGSLAAGVASADRPEKIRPVPDEVRTLPDNKIRIVPEPNIDIELWTDRGENGRYCVGDSISIYFRTNVDAWVAILDTDTRGNTHRIFPNRWDREHFVEAGRVYRLPADGYRFAVEGPAGRETLHAIAAYDRRELRRAAERLIDGYERASYDPGYGHGYHHYKPASRHHSEKIAGEKIVVVPVPEDLGYATASHLVRDGRRCDYRPRPRPTRPWWR